MPTDRLSLGARIRLLVIGLLLLGFGAFMVFGELDFRLWGGLTAALGVVFLVGSLTGRTLQSFA